MNEIHKKIFKGCDEVFIDDQAFKSLLLSKKPFSLNISKLRTNQGLNLFEESKMFNKDKKNCGCVEGNR